MGKTCNTNNPSPCSKGRFEGRIKWDGRDIRWIKTTSDSVKMDGEQATYNLLCNGISSIEPKGNLFQGNKITKFNPISQQGIMTAGVNVP